MTGADLDPGPHPIHAVLADCLTAPGGGVVVDLGCGPGHTLAALRPRWPGTLLIGIDLQLPPPNGLWQTGADSGVLLVRADLSHPLPLRDASVAALICHNVIELLPDPAVVFAEASRVLRPGGQAVWSHTDFASLIIHGGDQELTDQICRAYAEVPQRWMARIDPRAGRRLPGLARRASLRIDKFDAHVLTIDRLTGHACRRIDEITEVACRHAAQQRMDLTESEVRTWRAQLGQADADGEFCFAETTFITTTTSRRS